jgi:hypothetical protein
VLIAYFGLLTFVGWWALAGGALVIAGAAISLTCGACHLTGHRPALRHGAATAWAWAARGLAVLVVAYVVASILGLVLLAHPAR